MVETLNVSAAPKPVGEGKLDDATLGCDSAAVSRDEVMEALRSCRECTAADPNPEPELTHRERRRLVEKVGERIFKEGYNPSAETIKLLLNYADFDELRKKVNSPDAKRRGEAVLQIQDLHEALISGIKKAGGKIDTANPQTWRDHEEARGKTLFSFQTIIKRDDGGVAALTMEKATRTDFTVQFSRNIGVPIVDLYPPPAKK